MRPNLIGLQGCSIQPRFSHWIPNTVTPNVLNRVLHGRTDPICKEGISVFIDANR